MSPKSQNSDSLEDEVIYAGREETGGSTSRDPGKDYYWRYIHDKNKRLVKKESIEKKAEAFIPYEAGRKIPIHERVAYYMNKLNAEDDDNPKKQQVSKHNPSNIKTVGAREIEEN